MTPDPSFESLAALYADLDERVRTIEQYLAVNDPYDPTTSGTTGSQWDIYGDPDE